ncbi:5-epiaristolochene 1,3-dihydroxylase [Platanthera zijinensis]|uniref:5-epiaristolochene 1,3-dihydroxylase n=1 Tax=Platanthera zijinensis TaxID=2320716 RepID=A0AAP0BIX4_9ASPA
MGVDGANEESVSHEEGSGKGPTSRGDNDKVEECDLQHLHYLKMVVKESLRLHPSVPFPSPLECMEDTKVVDYDIPAKSRVYVSIWSVGRHPKYWGDDAKDFRPERFKNNDVNFNNAHMEFISFGAGGRICQGMSLANAIVELFYANLMHAFETLCMRLKPSACV